jgi:hypothetical protein
MFIIRRVTKLAALAVYLGLFAMLLVAAGDFVIHG